ADRLQEGPGLVPTSHRVAGVLVAENVGQAAEDRSPGARVGGTGVHELARVRLHPGLELVRRPGRLLDAGRVVDEDGSAVAHHRREQESLTLVLEPLA